MLSTRELSETTKYEYSWKDMKENKKDLIVKRHMLQRLENSRKWECPKLPYLEMLYHRKWKSLNSNIRLWNEMLNYLRQQLGWFFDKSINRNKTINWDGFIKQYLRYFVVMKSRERLFNFIYFYFFAFKALHW